MGHLFIIDAIAVEDRRFDFKLRVDSANAQDLPVDKCFALEVLIDAGNVLTPPLDPESEATV